MACDVHFMLKRTGAYSIKKGWALWLAKHHGGRSSQPKLEGTRETWPLSDIWLSDKICPLESRIRRLTILHTTCTCTCMCTYMYTYKWLIHNFIHVHVLNNVLSLRHYTPELSMVHITSNLVPSGLQARRAIFSKNMQNASCSIETPGKLTLKYTCTKYCNVHWTLNSC